MSELYSKALREHQAGNLELAEKLYHSYLKEEPKNSDILHLLSILLAQKNDFLNARYFAEKALSSNPDSSALHNSMGNILHNLQRYDEAITHYQMALKLDASSASSCNNLGNVYYHLGELEKAKNHYQKAIQLRPNYVDACYNLSLVLIQQDLTAEAKKYLEVVLGLQPDHGHAYSKLAYLSQLQGKFTQALDYYRKSLELNKDIVLSHHNLGVLLTNKGKYDEAISYFKKVLELDFEHTEALYNLGAVLLLQKKPQDALAYFLRLEKLTAEFDVYYNLGVIYSGLGSFEQAISYFNKALELSPNNFAVIVNLGAIYLQLKDFLQAEKYYQNASCLHPEDEEVKHILSALQQKEGVSKSPDVYIKHLFDQYSPYFEKHLEVLGYKAPNLLFDAVKGEVGDSRALNILDLGCGTGLGGAKFKSIAKRLIGIDLSEKMLEIAANKDIYDELKLSSIEDAIPEFSDLDLIIAVDSLVYFGDLSDIFDKCYKALGREGLFAFTVEDGEMYPYLLQRSVRFAHTEKYIRELVEQSHFAILRSDEVALRKQGQGSIVGSLFVLKK